MTGNARLPGRNFSERAPWALVPDDLPLNRLRERSGRVIIPKCYSLGSMGEIGKKQAEDSTNMQPNALDSMISWPLPKQASAIIKDEIQGL